MPKQYTENLFASTYRDDFADSDNYHRILFNSGRPVQARELTQMQTIIQREIERFGSNIFKEGAAVNPGGPTVTEYEFIKLNTSINNLPADPDSLVGTIMTGQVSGVQARVVQVVEAEGSDPATLYVYYIDTAAINPGETAIRMGAGEDISNGSTSLTVQTTNTISNPAVGQGLRVSNGRGDFFTQGHFVFVPEQSIIVDKYNINDVSATIGFKVNQDVVTIDDTDDLYDNQGATPNLTSPGADRYRISLELINQDDVDSDESFVFFCVIRDSQVVQQAKGTDDYNRIQDVMALRTLEESGNYIVRPFKIKFEDDDSDLTKLDLTVSPGTAYVNGYRGHVPITTTLSVNKPISTTLKENEVVAADYGNYVIFSANDGLPNINTFDEINMYNTVGGTGTILGTCRVRAIEEDGANYRAYLFDIKSNTGSPFRNVKSIGTGSGDYIDLVLENGFAALKQASSNSLLFALPNNRPQSVTDVSTQVQRRFTEVANGSGQATITLSATGETFADTNLWVVTNQTGAIETGVSITGAGTQSASISGATASATLEVYAYVNKGQAVARTKTLTETTIAKPVLTDGNGTEYISLGKADVVEVVRVTSVDSDGIDLSARFKFDDGQRDNYYEHSRLIVNNGQTSPVGDVFVRYKYFSHGAVGDFFSINSYAGQGEYKDIPSHRLADGTVVSLRDVVDFRSVKDSDGQFDNAGTGARVHELPRNTDLINLDVTYYNSVAGKVTINEQGVIEFITGEEALDAQFPATPTDSLELYKVTMNPNTLDATDVATTVLEHKRYTMSDIGQLEAKVDKLIEQTSLTMLETDAQTLFVFDSAGNIRTKSGIFVDGFRNQFFSATYDDDYAAAVDPQAGIVRPSFYEDNIRLLFDAGASTNVVKKGDNVYLNYTEVKEITQDQASGFENVNPFAVIVNEGHITLSPSSDEWKESRQAADKIVDGGVELDRSQALLWNNWQWNWQGMDPAELQPGDVVSQASTTRSGTAWWGAGATFTTNTRTVDRVVSNETIREVVGNRIIDVALIPWMRSRKIFFKAEGLKPNTRHFPFFDGRNVSDWVREETFTRFSDTTEDYGNRYRTISQHPENSTTLISDGNGVIEGSFFIPNSTQSNGGKRWRFRSGSREFTVLDISKFDPETSLSRASETYFAQGTLETWQQTVRSTRHITIAGTSSSSTSWRVARRDPLAQSFYVEDPEGIFVTKARVYFQSKDTVVPVRMEIRPMVNGQPSSTDIVPGGVKVLSPAQVNVVPTQSIASVIATPTDFEFDEPVFLSPETEYCIVLLAESIEYNVYVSETDRFILGSTEKRITKQPSMGSLFKSQNGSTWEPAQKFDMTFQLFRANFTASEGEVILNNANVPTFNLDANAFSVEQDSDAVYVSQYGHGMNVGDEVIISGFDSATSYGGMLGSSILGSRTVNWADGTGYIFSADSAASESLVFGDGSQEANQNMMFDLVRPSVEFMLPASCSIAVRGKFTSGRSHAGLETRFVKDTEYTNLAMNRNNLMSNPRMVANLANETLNMGGEKSMTISLPIATGSNSVSPVVDLQRASAIMVHNMIDRQDSAATIGFNNPINYVDETKASGGSALSKHITTPTTLAQDAVGLNILMAAHRPPAAEIKMYYRVADDGQNLSDVDWIQIAAESEIPADQNPAIYREYRYLAGGQGGDLDPFTQFQVKIVFNSTNTSQVPILRDLRVIALAV